MFQVSSNDTKKESISDYNRRLTESLFAPYHGSECTYNAANRFKSDGSGKLDYGNKWRTTKAIFDLPEWTRERARDKSIAISLSSEDKLHVVAFDVDCKDLKLDGDHARKSITKLVEWCKVNNIPFHLSLSGGGMGWHLYIPVDATPIEGAIRLLVHIAKGAGVGLSNGEKSGYGVPTDCKIDPRPLLTGGDSIIAVCGHRKSYYVRPEGVYFDKLSNEELQAAITAARDGAITEQWIADNCLPLEKIAAEPAPEKTTPPQDDDGPKFNETALLLEAVPYFLQSLDPESESEWFRFVWTLKAMFAWEDVADPVVDWSCQSERHVKEAGGPDGIRRICEKKWKGKSDPNERRARYNLIGRAREQGWKPPAAWLYKVKPLSEHFTELAEQYPQAILHGSTCAFYKADQEPDTPPMSKEVWKIAESWRRAFDPVKGKVVDNVPDQYLKSQEFVETQCFDFTICEPGKEGRKINLARGPKLDPWPDEVEVDENLPGVDLYFHILRDWLKMDEDEIRWNVMFDADTVQFFWKLTGHRYRVLKGTNGIFKSTLPELVDVLMWKFAAFTREDEWDEKFNKPLIGAARCTIEEAVFAQSPKVMNEIKGRTGQPVLNARLMRTDSFPVQNTTRFTFSINEDAFGFTNDHERRGSIFETTFDWDVVNNPQHKKLSDETVVRKLAYLESEDQQRNLLTYLTRVKIDYTILNTPIINVARVRELAAGNRVVEALVRMVEAGAPLHNREGKPKVSFDSLLAEVNRGVKLSIRWDMKRMKEALKQVANDLQLHVGVQHCAYQSKIDGDLRVVGGYWEDAAPRVDKRGVLLPDIEVLAAALSEMTCEEVVPGAAKWQHWLCDPREGEKAIDNDDDVSTPKWTQSQLLDPSVPI